MPTIVTLIENKSDVSILFSIDDKETQKDVKDLLESIDFDHKYVVRNFSNRNTPKIIFENISNLDSISFDIVIPPPKMV
jgi:hypothetical protein